MIQWKHWNAGQWYNRCGTRCYSIIHGEINARAKSQEWYVPSYYCFPKITASTVMFALVYSDNPWSNDYVQFGIFVVNIAFKLDPLGSRNLSCCKMWRAGFAAIWTRDGGSYNIIPISQQIFLFFFSFRPFRHICSYKIYVCVSLFRKLHLRYDKIWLSIKVLLRYHLHWIDFFNLL